MAGSGNTKLKSRKNKRIYLSPPHMGGNELLYIHQAFESNWIAPLGQNVDGFENDLSEYTGVRHVAVLSSGTASIHLALVLLGVGHGDEVICQSFTFSATANPILYQGAVPVFVGSEADTWNMSPEYLEEAIKDRIAKGKKPKAVIPVHLYGMPAKMNDILSICNKYEIPVIEDAAEALGSLYYGRHVGSLGRMGVLSFNGNKIITTSGGGALISNDRVIIEQARYLATQARDPAPHYQHSRIGYNYRMSNIIAGIGRGQMKVIEERVRRRREIFDNYRKHLSNHTEIRFLSEPPEHLSNRWLTTITIDKHLRDMAIGESLRLHLEKYNIETRPVWKPLHLQPVFSEFPYYGEGTEVDIFSKGLCLPSGSNLSDTEIDMIIELITLYIK